MSNRDPKLDTVLCSKCRRTIRRAMAVVEKGKPVCGGMLASTCAGAAQQREKDLS